MITELTEEQKSKFKVYTEKWIQKGLTTEQQTLDQAIKDLTAFQKEILQKDVAPVVLLKSPLECWVAVCIFSNLQNLNKSQVESQVESQVRSQVRSQVESQVWSQVWSQVESQMVSQVESQVESQMVSQVESQVWSQVESQVESQVRSQVGSQVRSQVRSQVWSQMVSQVGSQVESQVWSQVGSQVESQMVSQVESQVSVDFVWPYLDSFSWASWLSFYDFMFTELGVKCDLSKFNILKDCQKYGMIFPLDGLCIVCQPPTEIHKNSNGLHNETGPAVSYGGDNEIYALNGVVMKKEYILTLPENIDGKSVVEEKNVEVRRELLRKVGIEKLLNDLPHKILDKRDNYELYSLDLSDDMKDCKYLKMLNPSINTFHLESVAPEIETVSEALLWRNNGKFENAEILT